MVSDSFHAFPDCQFRKRLTAAECTVADSLDIARHDKASFSVVDAHEVIPDELTCDYRSVLVFGRVDVVKDEAEKINALYLLCKKYASNTQTDVDAYISKQAPATAVFKMTVEHMSGKEGRRLALARKDQN